MDNAICVCHSLRTPASDKRDDAVQDRREVSECLSLARNDMDEIFGQEGLPGPGTLASPISPNIPPPPRGPPNETQPPGGQPGEDPRNDSEFREPLSAALATDLQMMDVTDGPTEVASSWRRSEALLSSELLKMDANDEYHWSSQDLAATTFAASSAGAHLDTKATLKPFGLLRGGREQVQIALWDIHMVSQRCSKKGTKYSGQDDQRMEWRV